MCASCNAVFIEPPHLAAAAAARCIHGTQGPDEITGFTAALSSGWSHRGNKKTTGQDRLLLLLQRLLLWLQIHFHSCCHADFSYVVDRHTRQVFFCFLLSNCDTITFKFSLQISHLAKTAYTENSIVGNLENHELWSPS